MTVTRLTMLLALLIGAGVAAVTLWPARDSSNRESINQALSDTLNYSSEAEKRTALIAGARNSLSFVTVRYGNDLLVDANCDAARERLERDYDNHRASPLMLAACMARTDSGDEALMFSAFNPTRELDRLILVGRTSGGVNLRVVYHFDLTCKSVTLVNDAAIRIKQVSWDSLTRDQRLLHGGPFAEVHLEAGYGPLLVPAVAALAVAVGDRNGQVSNFVEVFPREPEEALKRNKSNSRVSGTDDCPR